MKKIRQPCDVLQLLPHAALYVGVADPRTRVALPKQLQTLLLNRWLLEQRVKSGVLHESGAQTRVISDRSVASRTKIGVDELELRGAERGMRV